MKEKWFCLENTLLRGSVYFDQGKGAIISCQAVCYFLPFDKAVKSFQNNNCEKSEKQGQVTKANHFTFRLFACIPKTLSFFSIIGPMIFEKEDIFKDSFFLLTQWMKFNSEWKARNVHQKGPSTKKRDWSSERVNRHTWLSFFATSQPSHSLGCFSKDNLPAKFIFRFCDCREKNVCLTVSYKKQNVMTSVNILGMHCLESCQFQAQQLSENNWKLDRTMNAWGCLRIGLFSHMKLKLACVSRVQFSSTVQLLWPTATGHRV